MPARPWWRRIKLLHLNLLLWIGIAVLAGVYRSQLGWAWAELPNYVNRDISAPRERQLYVEAARLIRDGKQLERARHLLERSLAIDPNSDAAYWLGRYHLAAGEPDAALQAFHRFLSFDPTKLDAYLRASRIHERRLELAEAREVLQRGLDYFEKYAGQFEPRLEGAPGDRYAEKAVQTHADYTTAIDELGREVARIDRKLALYSSDRERGR